MKAPGIVQRHPELRWLVSLVAIVAAVTAVVSAVSGVFRDHSALRATGPDELVSKIRSSRSGGYAGTIVAKVDLGLSERAVDALAEQLPVGGALLNGSHTLRYWYGGSDRQRVAVIGPTSEQDLFRNGSQVLLWDTGTKVAQRRQVDEDATPALPLGLASPASLTPPQLAGQILRFAGADAATTLRSGEMIAGRPTYELLVMPTDSSSLVGSVRIEVDGRQGVPLKVQIYARGAVDPAVDVAFTSINFGEPAQRNFTFTPPPDASVRDTGALDIDAVSLRGSGWTQVSSYGSSPALVPVIEDIFGPALQEVRGSWGRGKLLSTPLLSLLVTSKGHVVGGAVAPTVLYRAVAP